MVDFLFCFRSQLIFCLFIEFLLLISFQKLTLLIKFAFLLFILGWLLKLFLICPILALFIFCSNLYYLLLIFFCPRIVFHGHSCIQSWLLLWWNLINYQTIFNTCLKFLTKVKTGLSQFLTFRCWLSQSLWAVALIMHNILLINFLRNLLNLKKVWPMFFQSNNPSSH